MSILILLIINLEFNRFSFYNGAYAALINKSTAFIPTNETKQPLIELKNEKFSNLKLPDQKHKTINGLLAKILQSEKDELSAIAVTSDTGHLININNKTYRNDLFKVYNSTIVPIHIIDKKLAESIKQRNNAISAALSLTFLCIIILMGVLYSKMWRGYYGSILYQPSLPNPAQHETQPFKEAIKSKLRFLKKLKSSSLPKRKKKSKRSVELKALLTDESNTSP